MENFPGKAIEHYADEAMFVAEPIRHSGPRVTLISAHHDPLGTIAQKAMAYQGKFPRSLEDISDADRRYYIKDIQKNVLGSPMEAVMFEFLFEGVTRGFTHQLVRQRVGASYQQESMRFAVKEDFPVAKPPSIADVPSVTERVINFAHDMEMLTAQPNTRANNYVIVGTQMQVWEPGKRYPFGALYLTFTDHARALKTVLDTASNTERMNDIWEEAVSDLSAKYNQLVEMGMPAEDARGLAPTNIMTKINYESTFRGLMDHAGLRLCTQAQYEWKQVWGGMIEAIRQYGHRVSYRTNQPEDHMAVTEVGDHEGNLSYERSSAWQYEVIADFFRPICFKTGKCEFQSDFDRYCPIREQVKAFGKAGVPSVKWNHEHPDLGIPAIRPSQWLDPKAAIRKDAEWRSEEQLANIRHRR